eukprot:FR740211.1.p2 GENE.FR740211.1~~FR740211.1.p2  ORF type:complete len:104 (-),score=37.93 FR740211.1:372-683(-)
MPFKISGGWAPGHTPKQKGALFPPFVEPPFSSPGGPQRSPTQFSPRGAFFLRPQTRKFPFSPPQNSRFWRSKLFDVSGEGGEWRWGRFHGELRPTRSFFLQFP